jgi:hypothetical protein
VISEPLCHIVHLPTNGEPAIVLCVVLRHLVQCIRRPRHIAERTNSSASLAGVAGRARAQGARAPCGPRVCMCARAGYHGTDGPMHSRRPAEGRPSPRAPSLPPSLSSVRRDTFATDLRWQIWMLCVQRRQRGEHASSRPRRSYPGGPPRRLAPHFSASALQCRRQPETSASCNLLT